MSLMQVASGPSTSNEPRPSTPYLKVDDIDATVSRLRARFVHVETEPRLTAVRPD